MHQLRRHPSRHAERVDRLQRIMSLPEVEQMINYEDWGSDKTYPHMAAQWAWRVDTPFKWSSSGVALRWDAQGMSCRGRTLKDVGVSASVPPCH